RSPRAPPPASVGPGPCGALGFIETTTKDCFFVAVVCDSNGSAANADAIMISAILRICFPPMLNGGNGLEKPAKTMKKVKVYEYANCATCRNALKFLDRNNVPYEKVPIVETPPTKAELKKMLAAHGGNLKKLFNTSGEVYRAMKIGDKLPSMTESAALDLLAA